jgi:hypothetical protein
MAYRDSIPDDQGKTRVGMQTDQILDVGVLTDRNRIGISSHHGSKKDRARSTDGYLPSHGCIGRNVAIRPYQIPSER